MLRYYAQMPTRKARVIIYGLISVPIMWFGFSIFAFIVMLPHVVIDNSLIAILVSAFIFDANNCAFLWDIYNGNSNTFFVFLPKDRRNI